MPDWPTHEPIRRASHRRRPAIQYVRIDHRRADIAVTEQLLNRADVVPVLEKVRGKKVSKRVRTDTLRHPPPPRAGEGEPVPPSADLDRSATQETRTATPSRWPRVDTFGQARQGAPLARRPPADRPRAPAAHRPDACAADRPRRPAAWSSGLSVPSRASPQSAGDRNRCLSPSAP